MKLPFLSIIQPSGNKPPADFAAYISPPEIFDVAKSSTTEPFFPPGNPIHQGLVGNFPSIPPYGAT